jgi:hypothetical protein
LIIPTQHQLASPGTITKQYNSNRSNYELTSSEEDDEFLFDSNNTSLDDLEDSFYTYSSNSTKKVSLTSKIAIFFSLFLICDPPI